MTLLPTPSPAKANAASLNLNARHHDLVLTLLDMQVDRLAFPLQEILAAHRRFALNPNLVIFVTNLLFSLLCTLTNSVAAGDWLQRSRNRLDPCQKLHFHLQFGLHGVALLFFVPSKLLAPKTFTNRAY